MPVTPGKSTTTTSPGFNNVVFLWELRVEQPRGIGGNVPHVLFVPSVADVHDALRRNLAKNERRQPEPLRWRQRFDGFVVKLFDRHFRPTLQARRHTWKSVRSPHSSVFSPFQPIGPARQSHLLGWSP